jgi:hypothetical protein
MTGGIAPSTMRQAQAPSTPANVAIADPGPIAQIKAQWQLAGDRSGAERIKVRDEAYNTIADALSAEMDWVERLRFGNNLYAVNYEAEHVDGSRVSARIWQRLEERRAKGAFLPEIPATQEQFEAQLLNRQKQRRAGDLRTTAAATGFTSNAAGFLGGAAGSIARDPLNLSVSLLTFGGGGAVTGLLRNAAMDGATNMAIEAVEQPTMVRSELTRLGEEWTPGQAAAEIGMAGVGGALFSLGMAGAVRGGAKLTDASRAAFETVLAKNWSRLPEAVQQRWSDAARVPDAELPDLIEAIQGRDNLTPDEAAAIAVHRRAASIEGSSPFEPNAAGAQHHKERLGATLARILADVPVPTSPPPAARRADLLGSAAPRSVDMPRGLDPTGVRAAFMGRVRGAESSGNDLAAARTSSAFGRYQFTSGTWLRLFRARFGSAGMSDADILAKRADGRMQDILMMDLTRDNAAVLRGIGAAETQGNLYLAHFAGARGAARLLGADPHVSAEALLGKQAVAANSFLRGMTAGDVIRWAHRKMGDGPAAAPGARAVLRSDMVDDAAGVTEMQRAQAQADIDRVTAEGARLREEQALAQRADAGLDSPAVPEPDRTIDATPIDLPDGAPDAAPLVQRDDATRFRALDEPILARVESRTETVETATGRQVGVRYALVEASDLIPSNTPDGRINPNYPADRQPRDRTRAASQAQISQISSNLKPSWLGRSSRPDEGAPIIARNGVVESGNGRTMALQQVYAQGGAAEQRYRQFIESQGLDTAGLAQPVLVRIRQDKLTPEDERAFAREANMATSLGMAPTEQALADADAITPQVLALYGGGDVDLAANSRFVRGFMGTVMSPTEAARLQASDGTPNKTALVRIRNALLAKAYDNPRLVENVSESIDTNIAAIGGALTDVAGEWSKLRSDIDAGAVDPAYDVTENLNAAVALIDRARRERGKVADYVAQAEVFAGDTITPATEGVLRWFFTSPDDFTRPAGRARVVTALQEYIATARAQRLDQVDMFGGSRMTPTSAMQVAHVKQVKQGERNEAADWPASAEQAPDSIRADIAGARALSGDGNRSGREGLSTGAGGEGPQPEPIDAGWTDPDAFTLWADPVGPSAVQQADALLHDIRADVESQVDMFGGPTTADQRAALERAGDGRIKADVTQKPPGSDGGLFDARASDMSFLLDEGGEGINPAVLLARFDAEELELKTIRDCL